MNRMKMKLPVLMLGVFALSLALSFLVTAGSCQAYKPAFEETTEYEQILYYAAQNLFDGTFFQSDSDMQKNIDRATQKLNESNLFAKIYLNDALLVDTTLPSMAASEESMAGEYHLEGPSRSRYSVQVWDTAYSDAASDASTVSVKIMRDGVTVMDTTTGQEDTEPVLQAEGTKDTSDSYRVQFWTDGTYTKECSIENLHSEYQQFAFFRKYAILALLLALVLCPIVVVAAMRSLPENTSGAALKRILCAAGISACMAALCFFARMVLNLHSVQLVLCRRALLLHTGFLLVYAIVCFIKRTQAKRDTMTDWE